MAKAPQESQGLAAGWAALGEGRWQRARTLFEESLADGDDAEALEGLSWAAWWLDDAAALFAAREGAYRLYKRKANAAGAARMATWLAADHLDFHGALAVANGWLRRAHRLLEPLDPRPEHGWLAFHEGYLAHVRGDSATARELGASAAAAGRRLGVPDLEMLGLALEGAALVASARMDAGMRCLDEATAAALEGDATIPISSAWACCFLVSACTAALDYERAFEWCDRIADFAERYGSRYMLAFCRAEYGAVHLWRGRWAEAEALLEAAVEDFSRSRPALTGGPLVTLAELRRRQGRTAESARLLDRAGPSERARFCRARLELDAGHSRRAVGLLERALRHLPDRRALERVPALETLVRAALGYGDVEGAAATSGELRELARLVGTSPLQAVADVSEALVAAARDEHERARALLEDAVDGFEAAGSPFDAARARIDLAESLAALGRAGGAEREARAALDGLLALGAAAEARRARGLLEELADRVGRAAAPVVTPREREVLALVAEGLTNQQIAARLVVSEHTVHRHVANILRKLGTSSRAAAAAHAVKAGLVDAE